MWYKKRLTSRLLIIYTRTGVIADTNIITPVFVRFRQSLPKLIFLSHNYKYQLGHVLITGNYIKPLLMYLTNLES